MQFDTFTYALFLPVVFLLYWSLQRHLKVQNAMLVAASYLFYGWWDWRFLGLIALTTLTTFTTGLLIERRHHARLWTIVNIVVNLCILATFKYLNFFGESTSSLLQSLGLDAGWTTLHLVLPVGISFYTFQAISYTVDVYRGDVRATTRLPAFMLYISFFPQLVAGPIERASHLLPQLLTRRQWDYDKAVVGMRQILWGLVKKIAVADVLAGYLDTMLYHPITLSATSVVMAGIIFAFQIYADFSGYSDIAIGSARLLGIDLTANFRYPFFSRSMRELWQRWHISLMAWFRYYVYIPLGGSRKGHSRTCINIMIVFALSGLWHGADWTFVLWGIVNGVLLLPFYLSGRGKHQEESTYIPAMFITFLTFAMVFLIFRANDLWHLGEMCQALCYGSWLSIPLGLTALKYIVPLVAVEWLGRRQEFPIMQLHMPTIARWMVYWTLLGIIAWHSMGHQLQYIYFQF